MIVVVGHGRSPEKKGWGERIDTCDIVVRMWDWEWQKPSDYGLCYDYGLMVLTPKSLNVFGRFNSNTPVLGWLVYHGKPTLTYMKNGIELDLKRWCALAKEQFAAAGETGRFTLTRGGAAACWAIEHEGSGGEVVLVGFDNIKLGINQPIEQSFHPRYWNLYMQRFKPDEKKVYPVGTSKTATHDMIAERELLKLLAERNGVKLQWAEEIW